MMRIEIEICGNNELSWEEDWIERMKEAAVQKGFEPDVMIDDCHNLCGECMISPYLLVNGRFVTGDSPESLFERYLQVLEELQVKSSG